jgi:hypothetical protein
MLMCAACVIPPSLELEAVDAGPNAAPVITSVRDALGVEFALGSPGTLFVGSGTISLTAADADFGDTLYFAVFFDYSVAEPTPPRAECSAVPSDPGSLDRTATCPASAVCFSTDVGETHNLEIDVYDRPRVAGGEPLQRGVEPGSYRSTRTIAIECVEATP